MRLLPLGLTLLLAFPALAEEKKAEESSPVAGLFAARNREDLPKITLASGEKLAEKPLKLRSGGYYEIEIEADGSAELALEGPDFFRAIWIDEIVISDIEIRPMGGIDSLEFDDAGTAEISFIALKPGRYVLRVRGAKTDDQRLAVIIE